MSLLASLRRVTGSTIRRTVPDSLRSWSGEQWRRYKFAGNARYCPVCQSSIRGFEPKAWFAEAVCPVCGCKDCHRASWLFLESLTDGFRKPTSMLHIAPETYFRRRLTRMPQIKYLSGDICPGKGDVVCDIQNMSFADNSFDLIYTSHVVNVIPDHLAAIRELFRVLKPGGVAIPQVPLRTDGVPTVAELSSPEARESLFGDPNVWRLFGEADYLQDLRNAGFEAEWDHRLEQVSASDRQKFGLFQLPMLVVRKPA